MALLQLPMHDEKPVSIEGFIQELEKENQELDPVKAAMHVYEKVKSHYSIETVANWLRHDFKYFHPDRYNSWGFKELSDPTMMLINQSLKGTGTLVRDE